MSGDFDPRQPALVERSVVQIDGQSGTRLVFVFRAIGCTYARRPGGGCTVCGFQPMSARGVSVSSSDLLAQFESVFSDPQALEGVVEVDLYNSGSFLSEQEIPSGVRAQVLDRLGHTNIRRILIESRPEFITSANLADAASLVGGHRLEVGIGLESASDYVRDVLIHKGFGRTEFEQAVKTIAYFPVRLLVYLLVKPLGLTESEAVTDAQASANYVFDLARKMGVKTRVALQPVFVAPGTVLEQEFLAGRYHPPNLWSVIEIVKNIHRLGNVLVGLSDEGLRPLLAPLGCDRCTPLLVAALQHYNRTSDLVAFRDLDCQCRRPSNKA